MIRTTPLTEASATRKAGANEVDYREQAQKDFAMYAQMTQAELNAVLDTGRRPQRGRMSLVKHRILELVQTDPQITQREIARRVGCHWDYVHRVLKGTR